MHPGGLSVLLDPEVGECYACIISIKLTYRNNLAGQDATEAFFALHRYEVLEKPQYQRLRIGLVEGEKPHIHGRIAGQLSKVPYGEPTWLSDGYYSPYYSEVCFMQLSSIQDNF